MKRSIGIDLGIMTTHEVVALDPGEQEPRTRFRCGHSYEDLDDLLLRVQEGLEPGTKLQFVMEPTDTAWVPVVSFLKAKGHDVYLVKSEMVKDQRRVLKKHAKTDQIDAVTLAKIPWVLPDALHRLQPPESQRVSLRRRVKQAYKLTQSMTSRKRRIRAAVRFALPVGLDKFDLFGKAGKALCAGCLDPQGVIQMGLARLEQTLQRLTGKQTGAEAARRWFSACQEALKFYSQTSPVDYEDLRG